VNRVCWGTGRKRCGRKKGAFCEKLFEVKEAAHTGSGGKGDEMARTGNSGSHSSRKEGARPQTYSCWGWGVQRKRLWIKGGSLVWGEPRKLLSEKQTPRPTKRRGTSEKRDHRCKGERESTSSAANGGGRMRGQTTDTPSQPRVGGRGSCQRETTCVSFLEGNGGKK